MSSSKSLIISSSIFDKSSIILKFQWLTSPCKKCTDLRFITLCFNLDLKFLQINLKSQPTKPKTFNFRKNPDFCTDFSPKCLKRSKLFLVGFVLSGKITNFGRKLSKFCKKLSKFCRKLSKFCKKLSKFWRKLSKFCRKLSKFC